MNNHHAKNLIEKGLSAMDSIKQASTWQAVADKLMEITRRQHRFISDYLPQHHQQGNEYAAITRDLADTIGDMNRHIAGGKEDVIEYKTSA
jgi:hypothetical protein